MKLFLPLLLLTGCAIKSNTEVDAYSNVEDKRTSVQTTSDFEQKKSAYLEQKQESFLKAPDHVKELLPLLKAHHIEDLPSKATLEKHPKAEEALLWIALNGDTVGTKSRAVKLLSYYNTDKSTEFIKTMCEKGDTHHTVRASAFHVVAGWSTSQRTDMASVISKGLDDSNALVVVAACKAATGLPSLDSQIQNVLKNRTESIILKHCE